MKSRLNVLLVEGNELDEMMTRQAITNSEIDCDVRVAHDGEEACRMLFDSGEPQPSLILLEVEVPRLNGFELLSRIRSRYETNRVPVVMLAASSDQLAVNKCFDLRANSYVHKDKDLDCFEARVKLLLYYWTAVNQNGNA